MFTVRTPRLERQVVSAANSSGNKDLQDLARQFDGLISKIAGYKQFHHQDCSCGLCVLQGCRKDDVVMLLESASEDLHKAATRIRSETITIYTDE